LLTRLREVQRCKTLQKALQTGAFLFGKLEKAEDSKELALMKKWRQNVEDRIL
jgi:hypothetical protein